MTKLLAAFVVVVFLSVCGLGQTQLPRFEDFKVSEVFKGKPASVKLSSRRARQFRTMLKTNVEKGVNFAGHYTVATWGCGSDCRSIAIIDARNGNVYFTPSLLWIGGLLAQQGDRLEFRANSRLLIAAGARNDQGSGKYFYVWKKNVLKLIRAVEVRDWKEESNK
ncbi:MAG TPA: hypothetical protein VJU86_06220 [Pyrinomonadaceae bacterium]|nr:hypothetical protein [Pyrinomonadaceae bacterium]